MVDSVGRIVVVDIDIVVGRNMDAIISREW